MSDLAEHCLRPRIFARPSRPLRRLCQSYKTVARLPLLSPAFAHAIDPAWPLCPFETAVRGACRDAACAFQMRADYALPPSAVLQDVYNLVDR